MNQRHSGFAFLALFLCSPMASRAQASKARPADASSTSDLTAPLAQFEIADVHASPYTYIAGANGANGANMRWNTQGTDRFLIHHGSLLELIDFAYKFEPDLVLGGPTPLGFNHYDIVAKQPPSTPIETTRLMVRALLADRFKLVVHDDTRPMPAQLLTVGKGGPKMKPTENTVGPSQCQYQPPPAPPKPDAPAPTIVTFSCLNVTMVQFADHIRSLGGNNQNYPIVDQTGLQGAWDFKVTYPLLRAGFGYDIANALDGIGLKLMPGKAPQPVIVIDRLNETPTPNSPKLAELLPPPPLPAFDVAVIRPSSPDHTSDMRLVVNNSGQVTITQATLQILIGTAFNMSGADISDVPDFVVKDRWDIIGKIPQDDYPKAPNGALVLSQDDTHLMIRSLLVERFGLKAHLEDRPADAWTLTAVHPKLNKTVDASARTSCNHTLPLGEKDSRTDIRDHAIWCRNITMAQFASELMPLGWDYHIKSPVLDATHLDGSYDITLNWSPSSVVHASNTNNAANADAGEVSESAAPNGAISLPDAVSQQLGLKLEMQKRNMPRIVIDHIEKKPTQN